MVEQSEDASQNLDPKRTPHHGGLRNLSISALRLTGHPNIAAAQHALTTLGTNPT